MKAALLLSISCLLFCQGVLGLPGNYLAQTPGNTDFALVGKNSQALIQVAARDHKGVLRAVTSLQQDIANVSGKTLAISHSEQAKQMLIIGSLGNNPLLEQLIANGKLDVSAIAGKWEAFQIQVIPQPLPGIEQALVIVGSDKRGTIYGVFDLAETLGVSPWHWWADVPVLKSEQLYIKADTLITNAPKVKYRGIFLNDEYPALTNWVTEKFGGYNSQFYLHVFELMQRLKANFLWPAMWNNAFADDDWQNAVLADEMGIVMSNSHHEPMLRADKEWNRYGEGPWEYSTNRDNIYRFWQEGARRHKDLESIFTLGMRGQEDQPMSEGDNIELLQQIVADQRQILQDTFTGRPIESVPQVWALYKEVQDFYERGMRVPDDVTLLWADDNFGNIRRLPSASERNRAGGAGVYYHFDYVGSPRSYRWINTVSLAKIWEQMNLAWQYQADRIWIVNVGDLKPMEFPIDFFLRMAWNPDAFNSNNLQQFATDWAAQQFGHEHAAAIAELLQGYTRHNGRRKPEAVEPDTYSIFHYGEAEQVSNELATLVTTADQVQQQLAPELHDAFIQLVAHPLKASQAVFELNRAVAMNKLHGAQGRVTTNFWAEQVRFWFDRDAELTNIYHSLGDGRWNHMMSQPHIGYTYWRNPPANLMPVVAVAQLMAVADMGVAAEGSPLSWPISEYQGKQLALGQFYPHGQQQRRIEVFNKGAVPFNFSATASADWITLSHNQGEVQQQQAIHVSIDWSKASDGLNQAQVHIQGTGWGGAIVRVSAFKPAIPPSTGFVEADGYIAINAASANVMDNSSKAWWQRIPGHGRYGAAMAAMTEPDYQLSNLRQAPYLEYPLFFHSSGDFTLHSIVAPTLKLLPGRRLRFAVALDDNPPQVVDTLPNLPAEQTELRWQQAVLDGVRIIKTPLKIGKPGAHTLRIYLQDPAVVLQKLLIDTGGLQPSYLGPPPSQYLPQPLVKINQTGYPTAGQKLAIVVGDASVPFTLTEVSSGRQVFNGQTTVTRHWQPARQTVSVADFSALQQNGRYRLQVAGYAAVELDITSKPYSQLHDSAIKAFYYNRASTALLPEHAGRWARDAGHPDDQVKIHTSAASASRPAGTIVKSAKGWYDAGDYNKYVVNSGISTYTLLLAFTDFRSFYQQRQWQIPESGNDIPDLLDEIMWNLDWLSSMQDPTDGGVYHKLTTLNFEGIVMPADAKAQRYLVQKSTAATLNFVAVMAKASRILQEYESQWPGKAKQYRQQALDAWQWARQHPAQLYQQPADVFTGAYGDNQLADEMAWAAAELFLLTGEHDYLQQFFRLAQPVTTPSWANVASLGYFSLANNLQQLSAAQRQQVFDALTTAADAILMQHQASAYRVAMQQADFVWGSNAVALNKAILLHKAGQLNNNMAYLPAIQGLLDYVLGRNPTDFSYVTGYGHSSPQHIHHRPSAADGIAAPVPGWLAGGAQPGQQDNCQYSSPLPAKAYLDDWCSYATNEVTINWNAPLVYILAAMMQD